MPKQRSKRTKGPGRLRAVAVVLAVRSGSSSGRRRVIATRATMFTEFVSKNTSTATKIDVIRSGVAARIVDDMVEYLDVPKSIVFGVLHTPESTAHKLIKDKRTLDSAASERVVRVADIARMAEETFGGRDAATQWLKSPNLALGRVTPLSMLDTEPGAGEVRRVLAAINYGGTF
jgi:putative toxin-antitoxin system antitoxin component (TIGR02293 family)